MTAKILCELEVLHAAAHRDGGPAYEAYAATMFQVFPQLVKRIRELWGYLEKAQRKSRQTEASLEEVQKERDEARAEVERLKESVTNLDALYVSRTDALRESEAEVERLKGKLMEEARWVYDTGQRAKDALAEVERLREVVRQVHSLVSTVRVTAVLDDIEKLREIHKITKGMVK